MTKERIEEIVRVWQSRLQLGHWDIKIRWEMPVELTIDAEIKISDDYEQASIRIQQLTDPSSDPPTYSFVTWDDYAANRTIVHELLHIFEKQTRRSIESAEPVLPKTAYELMWAWYCHGSENWVDRLAIILVELGGVV